MAALIGAAICLAFGNSLHGPFVFDDLPSIPGNPTIGRLWSLPGAWSPPADGRTVLSRPLLNVSLALNHALGGLRVEGYHAVNLAIHLAAALTLFGIVRRTLAKLRGEPSTWVAASVALLWAMHPLQTEAVTYLVQRAESLMGLCLLFTLHAFIRGWWTLSVLACLAGMGVKESMAVAPVLVLAYDRTLVAGSMTGALRSRKGYYLALAATWIWVAALVAGAGGDRNGSMGIGVGIHWREYLQTQPGALLHYLRLVAWPRPLIFEYGIVRPATGWPLAAETSGILALAVLVVAGWLRREAWAWLGVWFFGTLAPTSLVPGATQMIVEHRLYLASAAVVTALVLALRAGVDRALPSAGARRVLMGLCAAAVLAEGMATRRRNADYRSGLALWGDTVAKRPGSAIAQKNLGIELARLPGHEAAAESHYRAAIALAPGDPDAHEDLALLLGSQPGRAAEARAEAATAVGLRPNDAGFRITLGNASARLPGESAAALAEYTAALRMDPGSAVAHFDLANLFAAEPGRAAEAEQHYRSALRIDPASTGAHANYGGLLVAIGRPAEAAAQFEAALRLRPADASLHAGYAAILAGLPGRLPDAAGEFETALRLEPRNAACWYDFGIVAARLGRRGDAIAAFRQALIQDPKLENAAENLRQLEAAPAGGGG